MPAPNRKLPSYSAVWFALGQRPGDTTDGNQAVVELFHWGADAMTWASDRVEERVGGAIVLSAEAGSLTLLGKFGTVPAPLRRELVGNPIALDRLNSTAD
jgi:hypothetical protein